MTDIAGPTAAALYSITAATYDHRNLPLSLTRNGVTTSYRYDDHGQRVAKQVSSGDTEVHLNEAGPHSECSR